MTNLLPIIMVLIMVETGGNDAAFNKSEGAVGCLQIRDAFFHDANQWLGYTHTPDSRWTRLGSIELAWAYMNRYCTKKRLGREPTEKDYVQIHNGGCNWFRKKGKAKANLERYWQRYLVHKAVIERKGR